MHRRRHHHHHHHQQERQKWQMWWTLQPLRPPRAIALDLDGTLFNSAGEVSQPTRRALRAYVEQGGAVVLATGRGRSKAVRVAAELEAAGVPIPCVVCSDGAVALQRNTRARSAEDAWSVLWTDMLPGREYPLDALRSALPGASFCAEIDGLGGSIIDRRGCGRGRG